MRQWARRQRLFSMGLDDFNRPMYDRDDLWRLKNPVVDRRVA